MNKEFRVLEIGEELWYSTLTMEETVECFVETYFCKRSDPNFKIECVEHLEYTRELDDEDMQEKKVIDEETGKSSSLANYIEYLKKTDLDKFEEPCFMVACRE